MALTKKQAFEIQALRRSLPKLRDTTQDQNKKSEIEAELARIAPYVDEAGAIVMAATDADFQAVADEIKQKMKPLEDAIKDIAKISAAIAQAAAVIDAIIQAAGTVARI